jgi:hypothetical protein
MKGAIEKLSYDGMPLIASRLFGVMPQGILSRRVETIEAIEYDLFRALILRLVASA